MIAKRAIRPITVLKGRCKMRDFNSRVDAILAAMDKKSEPEVSGQQVIDAIKAIDSKIDSKHGRAAALGSKVIALLNLPTSDNKAPKKSKAARAAIRKSKKQAAPKKAKVKMALLSTADCMTVAEFILANQDDINAALAGETYGKWNRSLSALYIGVAYDCIRKEGNISDKQKKVLTKANQTLG